MSDTTKFYSPSGEYILTNNTSNKIEQNTNNMDIKYGVQGNLSIELDEKVKQGQVKPSKPEDDDELYRLKKPVAGAPLQAEEE